MLSQLRKAPTDLALATRVINAMARSEETRVAFTRHARDRQQERGVHDAWVLDVLSRGEVTRADEPQHPHQYHNYRMRLEDTYDRVDLAVTIPQESRLLVVTVI